MTRFNQFRFNCLLVTITTIILTGCGGGGGAATTDSNSFNSSNINTKLQGSSSESALVASSISSVINLSSSSIKSVQTSGIKSSSVSTSKASSSKSSAITTTADLIAPTPPTNFTIVAIRPDQVALKWESATDNVGVAFYTIYRDQVQIDTVFGSDTSYYDFAVASGKTYIYSIGATDGSGNWSALNSIEVTTSYYTSSSSKQSSSVVTSATNSSTSKASSSVAADTTLPTTPNQVAKVNAYSTQVDISWSAATDNIGVTGYRVYRDNILLSTVSANTLSYSDKTASPNVTYWYGVAAGDAAGNWSPQKFLNVLTPPSLTSGNVTLKWLPPTQRENGATLSSSEIGGYSIRYRLATDNTYTYFSADKNQTEITFSNLIGDYVFEIAAYDANDLYSNFVSITPQ